MTTMTHSNAETSSAVAPRAGAAARAVATVCGIGYLKPGPGTWASAATTLAWAGAAYALPAAWRLPVAGAWALAATLIGIPAATRVARADRDRDPSHVVIDEVAGQMIALLGAPLAWKPLLAGLILFRCFDILKPPPVRQLERIPEGAGIVLDDVGAGLYALLVLQLLLRFGFLS